MEDDQIKRLVSEHIKERMDTLTITELKIAAQYYKELSELMNKLAEQKRTN